MSTTEAEDMQALRDRDEARAAERSERAGRSMLFDSYVIAMRAWSHGANGTMLPTDIATDPDAQRCYEAGMASRHEATKAIRERLGLTREEIGVYMAQAEGMRPVKLGG